MSYLSDFERSFTQHTLKLVQEYSGSYDVTLIVNCLLGLLVVPKETMLDAVPEEPISKLHNWGIDPNCIKSAGSPTKKNPHPDTLRGLVTNLRHSVAHFRIKPIPATQDVHSFEYRNDVGLHAVIPVTQMREFVQRLSEYLANQ